MIAWGRHNNARQGCMGTKREHFPQICIGVFGRRWMLMLDEFVTCRVEYQRCHRYKVDLMTRKTEVACCSIQQFTIKIMWNAPKGSCLVCRSFWAPLCIKALNLAAIYTRIRWIFKCNIPYFCFNQTYECALTQSWTKKWNIPNSQLPCFGCLVYKSCIWQA